MEERVELRFADEARELVVRAEVRGGESGEGGGVEARLLADGGHELPGTIHEQGRSGRYSRIKTAGAIA